MEENQKALELQEKKRQEEMNARESKIQLAMNKMVDTVIKNNKQ